MIRFECDYGEGAHPSILKRLQETNFDQTPGYGEDGYCDRARGYIREACGDNSLDVHFLVGGTQANLTVIGSVLRPHQGVISAVSGHINTHETGAIEATGHKVLAVDSRDGKISAGQVADICQTYWEDEHTVQPGMVYISHPTENGTSYTKKELEELRQVCNKYQIPLYMDGARLGYGLAAENNDLEMGDIAKLCDVFYIGGTKVGALFGEAVVIRTSQYKKDFRYHMKQRGGLLAKGRLLGIQFEALFSDNLYLEISKHAVAMAMKIRDAFKAKGYAFLFESGTNQQFPILPNDKIDLLQKKYSFFRWEKVDEEHSAVRFVTSWATNEESVDRLIQDIEKL